LCRKLLRATRVASGRKKSLAGGGGLAKGNMRFSATEATHSQRPVALVVDDSVEVAEVTSSLFERLGYDTVYRDSAEAALRFLAEGTNVDLLFSDIVMPGTIDGVGLAHEVQRCIRICQ
jgi:response regulator RpfG family c-di-GMP phosphodiesterase